MSHSCWTCSPLQSTFDEIHDVSGDSYNISETAAGPWTLSTTYGMGYTLDDSAGTDAAFTSASGYKQIADISGSETAQAVMSNAGPITNNQVVVTYKLIVGPFQPDGTYTNNITYRVTGNF